MARLIWFRVREVALEREVEGDLFLQDIGKDSDFALVVSMELSGE